MYWPLSADVESKGFGQLSCFPMCSEVPQENSAERFCLLYVARRSSAGLYREVKKVHKVFKQLYCPVQAWGCSYTVVLSARREGSGQGADASEIKSSVIKASRGIDTINELTAECYL